MLYVGSDARDTDFTVKLVDVHPDGAAWNVDDTILRARYREGFDRPVFLREGESYERRATRRRVTPASNQRRSCYSFL